VPPTRNATNVCTKLTTEPYGGGRSEYVPNDVPYSAAVAAVRRPSCGRSARQWSCRSSRGDGGTGGGVHAAKPMLQGRSRKTRLGSRLPGRAFHTGRHGRLRNAIYRGVDSFSQGQRVSAERTPRALVAGRRPRATGRSDPYRALRASSRIDQGDHHRILSQGGTSWWGAGAAAGLRAPTFGSTAAIGTRSTSIGSLAILGFPSGIGPLR
jgi:hypothetical protein